MKDNFETEVLTRLAVIESKLDKNVGCVATLLIQNGTLRLGDPIVVGSSFGKIRTLKNDKGEEETIDLLTLTKKQMRQTINGKRIAMVFQDPYSSLNPRMTVSDIIADIEQALQACDA
mgnify:CR=1 FL=1